MQRASAGIIQQIKLPPVGSPSTQPRLVMNSQGHIQKAPVIQ